MEKQFCRSRAEREGNNRGYHRGNQEERDTGFSLEIKQLGKVGIVRNQRCMYAS